MKCAISVFVLGLFFAVGVTRAADASAVDSSKETCTAFCPGDALGVIVYPETEGFPNGVYHINDNGYANLPIIGLTKITGRSRTDIEKLLRTAYVNFLPHPNLHVQPMIRASCTGGFYEPGLYYINPERNMWELIRRAGGTQREDGITKIRWERDGSVVARSVVPCVQSGVSLAALGFQSGDQLTVTARPKSRFREILTDDILPVLSFAVSTAATTVTAYFAYQAYKEGR